MSAPDRGIAPHRSPSSSTSPVSRWDPPRVGLGIGGMPGMSPGPSVGGVGGGGGAESSPAETLRQGTGLTPTPIPRPQSRTSRASQVSAEYESSSEEGGSSTVRGGAAGSRPTSRGSDVSRGGTRRWGRPAPDLARPGSGRRRAADESSRNLHGRLHIEADRVIDMDGAMGLWFLFMVG